MVEKEPHETQKEIWLVYYKKHTGKPRVPYNGAVEEALCFGRIDSTVRSIDKDRYAQRFSPRKPGSRYSQANLERIRALVQKGKVIKDVRLSLPDDPVEDIKAAPDIVRAIRANRDAWKNYRAFPPPYIRIRIAYIEGARKRPAEFRKRLANFTRMAERNKRFGFGGIEKYY